MAAEDVLLDIIKEWKELDPGFRGIILKDLLNHSAAFHNKSVELLKNIEEVGSIMYKDDLNSHFSRMNSAGVAYRIAADLLAYINKCELPKT